jgi:hypothetical protein
MVKKVKQMERIQLAASFEACNSKGDVVRVESMSIDKSSYIADVCIKLEQGQPGIAGWSLADDEAFLKAVFAQLAKAGYSGPAFGRAESGMQGVSTVMLEPCAEFERFAASKGWEYADGMAEWEFNNALRHIPNSWQAQFEASDGSCWTIPLSPVAAHHAKANAHAYGGDVARSLLEGTIPAFKAEPKKALSWIREKMGWDEVGPHARQIRQPKQADLASEFPGLRLELRGMG